MSIKQKIKDFFLKRKLSFTTIEYDFLGIEEDKRLISYINKIAKEIADREGVPIVNVSFDELNKDVTNESEKAIGVFKWHNQEAKVEYDRLVKRLKELYVERNKTIPVNYIYPRIEITEKASVLTIVHELGHYFLYKNGIEQSEKGADSYIEEFFEHLPPFFKWVFQIEISIRTKKEVKYTQLQAYYFIEEYKKFIKDHGSSNADIL